MDPYNAPGPSNSTLLSGLFAMLDKVTDGLTIQDNTGKFIFVNHEAASILGFPSPQALLNTPLLEMTQPLALWDDDGQPFGLSQLSHPARFIAEQAPEIWLRFQRQPSGGVQEDMVKIQSNALHNIDGQLQFTINLFKKAAAPPSAAESSQTVDHPNRDSPGDHATLISENTWLHNKLQTAQVEHRHTEEELDKLKLELESRVERRTDELRTSNITLEKVIAEHIKTETALKTSEELYRSLLDFCPDMVVISSEGQIIYINEVGVKLLGAEKAGQLLGSPLTSFVYAADGSADFERIYRSLLEGGDPSLVEGKLVTLKGQEKIVKAVSTPLTINQKLAVLTFVNDITEQNLAEKKLLNYTKLLEQSNRELEEFAQVASHDLQEPLRKIIVFADRLKATNAEKLDDRGIDYLTRMEQASRRMQILINDLLSFARLSSRSTLLGVVNLTDIINEVLADLEMRLEQTGGRVEMGPLPALEADPVQMGQLFQNLIANALKFHNPSQNPLVKISSRMLPGPVRNCEILIEDNGIGFEERYLDKIFGVFQRLHSREKYEGSGIGLAVCRKIVLRHGGSITARSIPDEGTTFIITLPLQQA